MRKIALLVKTEKQEALFHEKYYTRLRNCGELVIYDRNDFEDLAHVINFVEDSEVLITSWGSPVISKEILNACPNLKAVIHAAGSIKPLITEAFLQRRVRITNSAIALGEGVAETALGFAISACKGFYQLNRDTSNNLWNENEKKTVKDFYDITIGVIGGGFVGRHMIKLLRNFHVDILMYDPTLSKEDIHRLGAQKADLSSLMAQSDVVTVHAPSIPETANLLNRDNLCLMKDGAVLINTARGAIINEKDLIEELKKNRIFACIDVTEPEPPEKDNELRSLDNVILTPHIAGAVTNGLKRVALHVCEELERYCQGNFMKTEVPLENLSKLA